VTHLRAILINTSSQLSLGHGPKSEDPLIADEPTDKRAYEQECLRLTREIFANPHNLEEMRVNNARVFLGADLAETYPYTRLVVRFRDELDGKEGTTSFLLWSDDWVEDVPGKGRVRRDPLGVIDIITTNLAEPNRG
jgi:hypothetical protein